MKTKHLLLIGAGLVGIGAAYAIVHAQTTTMPELINESNANSNNAVANGKQPATVSADVRKIQDFLNRVINNKTPLVVDGVSGPATIARIKEFQQMVGRGNPVTGTWGSITEANALAVYGFTPFQGPTTTLKPVVSSQPDSTMLIAQGRLSSLLVNKYAYGNRDAVTFRTQPKVSAPVQSNRFTFNRSAIGLITDVAFDVVGKNQYVFVKVKYQGVSYGWCLLTDIEVYETSSGRAFAKKINL